MTRIEALEELAAKVEAGSWTYLDWPIVEKAFPKNWNDAGLYWEKSLNGSLDAAKSLHDALLPGWGYDIDEGLVTVSNRIVSRGLAGHRSEWAKHDSNPARAWLLAMLRALIEQEKANG